MNKYIKKNKPQNMKYFCDATLRGQKDNDLKFLKFFY
mgnify:CR=1 FL=1